jgi:tetratricopeptide (TPR) repeat protein
MPAIIIILTTVLASVLGICASFSVAETTKELIEQGDRLVQAEDRFPASFQEALALYRQAVQREPQNWLPYLREAAVCLALGDGLKEGALKWYQEGEQAAQKAVALKEDSADAHFLLAANRGNVVNLRPFWKVSPTVLADLESHLLRALSLDSKHARANHMMGMVLYRTPGPLRLLLVGKREEVESYLLRAVKADPSFAEARLDLAKFYLETGRFQQAQTQAEAILAMTDPKPRRAWMEKYKPGAVELLRKIPSH